LQHINITPAGLVPQAVASQHLPSQTPSPIKTPQRLHSVRTLLLCLVMGCMVPGIGSGIFLFVQNIQEGRQQLEQSSIQTAHTLGLALDQQFAQVETTALMLSQDPALQTNNLALFRYHAIAALARVQIGGSVVVTARAMLCNSSQQIQAIAEEVGYHNASDFSRAFRLRYGLGPRDYRQASMGAMAKPSPAE
jgi:hypothetical protein